MANLDKIGGPYTQNHYPVGWANLGNTPFQWYKTWVHSGGVKDPMIVSYPNGIKDKGAIRSQYHHVIDITPTVLDVIGIEKPEIIKGISQKPIQGKSFKYSFDSDDRDKERKIQYYEMLGNKGIYKNGWKAVTNHTFNDSFDEDEWELYHVDADYSEKNNVADKYKEEKIMKKRLIKKFLGAALAGTMAISLAACGSETTTSTTTQAAESEAAADIAEVSSSTADTEKAEELQALKIGIAGSAEACVLEGAALAIKDGYFDEELAAVGYYPEYVYFSGAGPEINEAFAGGSIDAAIVGDFPTFTAKSNGIDNTIIAATNQKVNYAILTTVEGAESIHDLKDYTAVVFNGSITQFFWQSYLEAAGIGANEIAYVNSSDATTLLTAGDAQIYPVTSYSAYFYESQGLGHIINTSDANIFTTFVFEINTQLINSNPDIGIAVNKELIRSAEAAQADPQKQYDASAGTYFDATAWEKYYSADPTLSNLSPEITDELLEYYEKENQWMLDNGVIVSPVDVSTFVDTSFYEKALADLGR